MQHTFDNAIAQRDTLVNSGYFTVMNEAQRISVVAVTLDRKVKTSTNSISRTRYAKKAGGSRHIQCRPVPRK